MDTVEREWREREFEQRREEFEQQRRTHKATVRASIVTAAVSVLALVVTIAVSTYTSASSDRQFRQQARDARYGTIVAALGSASAAVETNAMRLLVEFVRDDDNFGSAQQQRVAAVDAVQTLAAFIEDQSLPRPGRSGLSDYRSPDPIVLSRAMTRMQVLLGDRHLGRIDADISRGNFHGISLPDFEPHGGVQAPAADFRRADLSDLDLRSRPSSLVAAFFTCADLRDARFGQASLSGADFTGADLSGADLSQVVPGTLTPGQLTGATITRTTRLPKGLPVAVRAGWGADSLTCIDVVRRMTGMQGGQGYFASVPCPTTQVDALATRRDLDFTGRLRDLVEVCRARGG